MSPRARALSAKTGLVEGAPPRRSEGLQHAYVRRFSIEFPLAGRPLLVSGDATASVVARREETRYYPAASRSDTAFAISHRRGGGGCSICNAVAECSRLPTLRGRGPLRSSSAAATDSPSLTGLRHGWRLSLSRRPSMRPAQPLPVTSCRVRWVSDVRESVDDQASPGKCRHQFSHHSARALGHHLAHVRVAELVLGPYAQV